ncbi:MAG: polysaccharide deacetylase family protein [Verrucomicrobiales bacterium]|nr:polysaccharide deacetylase family protein [Verrucomicrobiales bacterium]
MKARIGQIGLILALVPGMASCAHRLQPPVALPADPRALQRAPFTDPVTGLTWQQGAIRRGSTHRRDIALLFTAHTFAEGGETILDELARRGAKASFFLTGEFLDTPEFAPLVRRMVRDGHYVGPHSDRHLLYCSWEREPQLLVTRAQFRADLAANLRKLERFGLRRAVIRYFVPPYEHYTADIATWTREAGLTLISFTPGTRSTADYTGEADKNFVPTDTIFESILQRERADPHGLNGFLLLLHLGSGPGRADKFHRRFGELLDVLGARGYRFVRVEELLGASLSGTATARGSGRPRSSP